MKKHELKKLIKECIIEMKNKSLDESFINDENAYIVHDNGRMEKVEPRNKNDFQADELNDIVGGHFEIVPIYIENVRHWMVLNEEGKIHELPINKVATKLFVLATGRYDSIHGDVLICKEHQIE